VPNLVSWVTKPGESYDDLDELYGETVGMWALYMGHVVTVIGGVNVDFKTAEQSGAVYHPVPKAKQKAALQFLTDNAIKTPEWLAPEDIVSRIGPQAGAASLCTRQSNVVAQLLDARRLMRLADSESLDESSAYPLTEYLSDLRRAVWATGAAPDANRRTIQRVYLERLDALISPPAPPAAAAGAPGGGGPPPTPGPLLAAPNVPRTDLPALARSQVRSIRDDARRAAAAAPVGMVRAHWQDIADRADHILDPKR
jgi:Met-zincin